MKRTLDFIVTVSLSLILLTACNKENVNQKAFFYDIDVNGLGKDVQYEFHPFENSDSSAINEMYAIYLALRFSDNCVIKKLPINMEYFSLEHDSIKKSNFIIPLFDENDAYNGRGNFGIYEIEIPLFSRQQFEDSLSLYLSTPEENTKGILSLGIILNPVK